MEQNIEIAVRIKPTEPPLMSPVFYWDSESIQIADKNFFSYDYVLAPDSTQQQVFDKIGYKIISNVLQGYNGCIFAYGQTGSGKTFTMTGYDQEEGIIQKCLRTLWNCVVKSQFYEIKLSYFEIYNQTIKDLLSEKENLIVRQNSKLGFYVEGLAQKVIERYQDFQAVIEHGIAARTIKQTKMNQKSSRSHSVLEVTIAYKNQPQKGLSVLKHAKITFIDLAGSEKQKQTQVEGQRLKQAANINKSLSNLSLVISKLSQMSQKKSTNSTNQSTVHVPYRNSVLTKILKNSLTGKSKIIIVCTISLDDRFLDETLSTLRFAQTAKSIKMKVKKNEQQFDGTKDRLFEQFQEIKTQYNQLKQMYEQTQKINQSLKRQNAQLKDQIQKKQAEINELQINFECLKIQSQQVVREMRSQSMSQQFSQPSPFDQIIVKTQCRSESQYQMKKDWDKREYAFQQVLFEQKPNNSGGQSFFNQNRTNEIGYQSSQLSFFTTNLSSSFNSPQKSFFTIQQADEKQEVDCTSQFFRIQLKLKTIQKELKKLQLQRQFHLFDISLKQEQINSLTKRLVFTSIKQQQIESGHDLFAELVKNKQFSHAQLKFLKLCLQKSQKDKMTIQLLEELKRNQMSLHKKNTQKVKQLLIKYVQNQDNNQSKNIQEFYSNELFMKSPLKSQSIYSQNINKTSQQIKLSDRLGGSQNFNQQSEEQKRPQVRLFSQSQRDNRPNMKNQSQQQKIKNQPSFKKVSQLPFVPQMTQSMGMMGTFVQQSSQISLFMLQNRSMISQSSFKFTNNELEYLKKDYERLNHELKAMREQIEKKNIMLLEKDSLLEQKQREFQQQLDKNAKLVQEIIAQNEIRELENRKNPKLELLSVQKTLNQRQTELRHLKQHLQQTQRKHQQQIHTLKLQKKALEAFIQRQHQTIDQLKAQIDQQSPSSEKQKLLEQIKTLKSSNEEIRVQKGFLDAQNQFITRKYYELKALLKDGMKVDSPKKVYLKKSTFYSLSQSQSPYHQSSQSQSTFPKPQQLIQVIENKRYEDMYLAAYWFYKNTKKLEDKNSTLEKKINEITLQLKKSTEKLNIYEKQQRQHEQKIIQAQKQALRCKEMLFQVRQKQIQLKNVLLDKRHLIEEHQFKNKQLLKYCQTLQAKLIEKQHKEFQSRQKFNNLAVQIKQNAVMQTPSQNQDKNKPSLRNRLFSQSSSSLSSEATDVRPSSYFNDARKSINENSRRSIQIPLSRTEKKQDMHNLFGQIEEISNDDSKAHNSKTRSKFFQTPASLLSHTVTNPNLIQQKNKSKRFLHSNLMATDNLSQIDDLDSIFFTTQQKKSKASSIKSDSNCSGSNLRKSINSGIFSKH